MRLYRERISGPLADVSNSSPQIRIRKYVHLVVRSHRHQQRRLVKISRVGSSFSAVQGCSKFITLDEYRWDDKSQEMWELSKWELPTRSTVCSVIYLMTVTVFFWPIRSALATACSSTDGFHCGSTIWTRFATVSVSLNMVREWEVYGVNITTYPTAPVSMDMSKTRIFASSRNFKRISIRSRSLTRPSIRRNRMPWLLSIWPRISKVDRQDVKTRLQKRRQSVELDFGTQIYLLDSCKWYRMLAVTAASLVECPCPHSFAGFEESNGRLPLSFSLGNGDSDSDDVAGGRDFLRICRGREHSGHTSSPSKRTAASSSSVPQNSHSASGLLDDDRAEPLPCPDGVEPPGLGVGNVPWLQIRRSFIIVVKSTLYFLISEFVLTNLSNSAWQFLRVFSYISFSDCESDTVTFSVSAGDRSSSPTFRRKQMTRRRSLRFRKRSALSTWRGSTMDFWNTDWALNGSNLMNFKRDKRSSIEFWIGVPVRHHRLSAVRLSAALNCLDARFRIQCAIQSVSNFNPESSKITHPTSCGPVELTFI